MVAELAPVVDHARIIELDRMRNRVLPPPAIKGIWDDETKLFTRYSVTIQFIDRLMAATPRNPKVLESWLRVKAGIDDADEMREAMLKYMREQGHTPTGDETLDQLRKWSEGHASEKHGLMFLEDVNGLYFEGRKIKACLKENTNILYAGESWKRPGQTKNGKGPKSFLAERVHVDTERMYFGKGDPDGVYLMIGHVSGPQGPRSTLSYYDYMERPTLTFEIKSTQDSVTPEQWQNILVLAQENGLGALRSQGFGKFKVTAFDRLPG